MPKIRVLVVDDTVVMRRMISEVVGRDPHLEVVGVAANGRIALQKIPQVNPDILTLDVEMPELDGLATVRELRKTYPRLPVIMFSALTRRGAESTLEALAAGANDYLTQPANVTSFDESIRRLEAELIPCIKMHCRELLRPVTENATPAKPTVPPLLKPAPRIPPLRLTGRQVEILCIGTSTGGPNALADIFQNLRPRVLPVPIVIVQHMPPLFTKMLAERLTKTSGMAFYEGEEGQPVEAGRAYIAQGGKHMRLRREGGNVRVHLTEEPPENSCRPAVDVLFRSAMEVYGAGTLAVVMTGMGQDGLRGCQSIREAGGSILAQDDASSVVWGMPGAVVHAGLAEAVVPLPRLAESIWQKFQLAESSSA